MPAERPVREGVENLIRNCVGVEKGESILLLNEKGGVDADLVALMEEAIAAAGGAAYSLWVEPLTSVQELPTAVGSAIVAADKLVLNASLNRVVLLDHLRAKERADLIRINNRARTAEAISTEHATFNWRLVMALAARTEQVTAAASAWSITSPYGTDMRGRVASGSEVADAFFAQDAGAGRTERVFPGEVYAPVGSAEANDVIAFDHPGFADKERFANPMMLTVTDSVLTDIAWREEPARPGQRDDATGNTVVDARAARRVPRGQRGEVRQGPRVRGGLVARGHAPQGAQARRAAEQPGHHALPRGPGARGGLGVHLRPDDRAGRRAVLGERTLGAPGRVGDQGHGRGVRREHLAWLGESRAGGPQFSELCADLVRERLRVGCGRGCVDLGLVGEADYHR